MTTKVRRLTTLLCADVEGYARRAARPGARLDEAEAGGSGGMDRVLWEAGGVEAIGLQVVTIQYWRPELGCREGAESGPSLPTPVGPDTTRSTHSSEPQQTVRKAERGHSAVPCSLRWYVSGGCTFESSPARQSCRIYDFPRSSTPGPADKIRCRWSSDARLHSAFVSVHRSS